MQNNRSYLNLHVTYNQAAEKLAALKPEQVAQNAGLLFDQGSRSFLLPFLNCDYRVDFAQAKFHKPDGEEASLYHTILMLHYLIAADGTPLTGQWISFRHLPGGDIYAGPFQKRAVVPFLKTFGHRPDAFSRAAAGLGGVRGPGSGLSMIIPALPRVPLCFTLWPGDDELPAAANILFDAQAPSYLPTEDYAHLPAMVTGAMKDLLDG